MVARDDPDRCWWMSISSFGGCTSGTPTRPPGDQAHFPTIPQLTQVLLRRTYAGHRLLNTSTWALTDTTLPYAIPAHDSRGAAQALEGQPALARGLNTRSGNTVAGISAGVQTPTFDIPDGSGSSSGPSIACKEREGLGACSRESEEPPVAHRHRRRHRNRGPFQAQADHSPGRTAIAVPVCLLIGTMCSTS